MRVSAVVPISLRCSLLAYRGAHAKPCWVPARWHRWSSRRGVIPGLQTPGKLSAPGPPMRFSSPSIPSANRSRDARSVRWRFRSAPLTRLACTRASLQLGWTFGR